MRILGRMLEVLSRGATVKESTTVHHAPDQVLVTAVGVRARSEDDRSVSSQTYVWEEEDVRYCWNKLRLAELLPGTRPLERGLTPRENRAESAAELRWKHASRDVSFGGDDEQGAESLRGW